MIAEPKNEVENLLSLIFQSGGQVMVKDGQLLVGPPELAKKFGDQIRKLKPEILLALGHCLVCTEKLISKVEETERSGGKRTGLHIHCLTLGHYDKWEF